MPLPFLKKWMLLFRLAETDYGGEEISELGQAHALPRRRPTVPSFPRDEFGSDWDQFRLLCLRTQSRTSAAASFDICWRCAPTAVSSGRLSISMRQPSSSERYNCRVLSL